MRPVTVFLVCLFFIQVALNSGKINLEQTMALVGCGLICYLAVGLNDVDN